MVTFRKDIHLGRRVPVRPEDENECMLVSISENGLAVDKYGRKWRFLPWGDILAVPTIALADVTAIEYPELTGKRRAVYEISIAASEEGQEIQYKIIEVGIPEPAVWETYDGPFTIKTGGVYQIAAKAKMDGVDSEAAISDAFNVVPAALAGQYSDIIITLFEYDQIPAAGGTFTPRLAYTQAASRVYTDGHTESLPSIISGATLAFSGVYGIGTLNGSIAVEENKWKSPKTIGNVSVTVNLNGKTATKSFLVTQAGKSKSANTIHWRKGATNNVYDIGATVEFEAYTADNAPISYRALVNGMFDVITSPITIQEDMIITAVSDETVNYDKAESTIYLYVKGEAKAYIGWGINLADFNSMLNDGDGGLSLILDKNRPHRQLMDSNAHLDTSIYNTDGELVWIACRTQFPSVTILNGWTSQPVTLNWHDADSTFSDRGCLYSIFYAELPYEGYLDSVIFPVNVVVTKANNWVYDGTTRDLASISGADSLIWAETQAGLDTSDVRTIPTAKDAGTYTRYWKLPGTEQKGSITVVVSKRTVNFVSQPAQKPYDGQPLTNNAAVEINNQLSGEQFTAQATGTITTVGETPNTIVITNPTGYKASNYTIQKSEGILEVTAAANTISWGTAPTTPVRVNNEIVVSASSGADNDVNSDIVITYYFGSQNNTTGHFTPTTADSIQVYAKAHDRNGNYSDVQTAKATVVIEEVQCIYALSGSGSAPAPTTESDLTSPDASQYPRTGNFTSGTEIDCSATTPTAPNARFRMSWFAIPKNKTLKIETVSAGDNITEIYTPTVIGDYKVYIQTENVGDPMQDVIRLTIL